MKQLVILALFVLAACSHTPPQDNLSVRRTDFSALPGWQQGDYRQSLVALKHSCNGFVKQNPSTRVRVASLEASIGDWQALCRKAQTVNMADNTAIRRFFEQGFVPYKVSNNGNTNGLFTGYYEPAIKGSLHRRSLSQEPIYRLPPEKSASKPYYTRAQIYKGALRGRGLEIAYIDDPVEAFFLEIQGSGRVLLDNGQVLRVGYAGKNNHPYVSIGKYLKERGMARPDQLSAQGIKAWLRTHPAQARQVMEVNPSYVFFTPRSAGQDGPIGGQGVPLTPYCSLAVDKRFIPYGVPLWVNTVLPGGKNLNHLMIAQDTGGAIKGPVRGDIFFGYGQNAEQQAGYMKNSGEYALLWPRR